MNTHLGKDCYHCSLPVPKRLDLSLQIFEQERHFCCMGCYSVAETIMDSGMSDYYKFRSESAITPEQALPDDLFIFDQAQIQAEISESSDQQTNSIQLLCEAIRCSACAWLIEKSLSQLGGVSSVQVNVSQQSLVIEWQSEQIKLSEILKKLHQLGYPSEPYKAEKALSLLKLQEKAWLRRLGLAGLGMMQVMMYAVALYIGVWDEMSSEHRSFLRWVSFFVATPVLIYAGYPFYQSAFRSLKQLQLNMDVPISLALLLAYVSSIGATIQQSGEVYFDSVTMFVFFLLIGRYLEFRSRQKLSQKVYQGNKNLPLYVERFSAPEQQQSQPTALAQIEVEDIILIKAGSTLPFDGTLIEGNPELNEALLNGEFMPQTKSAGDKLLAGSINNSQPFKMKVSHKLEQGYWSQLLALQDKALASKPHFALLADKIARYFVLAILLLAAGVYAYWSQQSPQEALWITLSVLVVTCPCALSLATPIALTCGVNALNKKNFLVKQQDFLPRLNSVSDIIFDKTGTLTKGELQIADFQQFSQQINQQNDQQAKEYTLAIIAALETQSEHPIAKVFKKYKQESVNCSKPDYSQLTGVSGIINQETYWFGNANFIRQQLINFNQLELADLQNNGLYLVTEKELICHLTLSDSLRDDAKKTCDALKRQGYQLHLLSGDPSEEVERLAFELGMDSWSNNCSPQNKQEMIKLMQTASTESHAKSILMVGDGLNDAPAMSQSNASIAMAAAADLTRMSADSYLMSEKLTDIPQALNKALVIEKTIKQNLGWALAYNLIMIPFAASGMIPPYLAAIGMSLSSIVVVMNSLKLNSN